MKRLIIPFLCIISAIGMSACNQTSKEKTEVKYNPYVEAFTSGRISRFAPIYILFSQEIPAEFQTEESARKQIQISPKTAGTFSFENNKVLVFTPAQAFERDKKYTVTADLSTWFNPDKENQQFSFQFATVPPIIRGNWESLDLASRNDAYNYRAVFYTSDREEPQNVETAIRFTPQGKVVWTHATDGKKHIATLYDVAASKEEEVLAVEVGPNKQGWKEEELFARTIPATGSFNVYDVSYKTTPERMIEITFTQPIDRDQDLLGLIFIDGEESATPTIEGNKVRLFPNEKTTGKLNVHVNYRTRSQSGIQLPKDVITQVSTDNNKPAVRFTGNGVIIPQSGEMTVSFQAIHLRGVIVKVIKVLQQNMGQFLQNNQLDQGAYLMQVGRPITRKTIFLDEMGNGNLGKWNTFSLNLTQLITPEPGAIYRIELSFNRDLSAYPCPDGEEISKADLLAQDVLNFQEESNRFDEGGYSYYYSDRQDWSKYIYEERHNPCSDSYYYYNTMEAKNILASNLGIMASAGEEGKMIVSVYNLQTTDPEKKVKIELFNFQHQLIGEGITEANGRIEILPTGKPFYIIASKGTERGYLRVDNGSALSLSSFDVAGEVLQKGIKGFIYGERGVWRPGDTLRLAFMLNDKQRMLPESHPVTMELINPIGQPYQTKTTTKGELGIYRFDMPTDIDAPTGSWTAKVTVGGATFTKRLRLETIKPNRLKIDLSFKDKILRRGEPLDGKLHLQWLQGATAHNLKYDIQGTFISVPTTFKGFESFKFDDPTKNFTSEESGLIKGVTDSEGNAQINTRLEVGKSAPGMLAGNLVVKAYEESGDFSLDATRINYSPYNRYVGIKAPFGKEKETLDTDKSYPFQVVMVDWEGKPVQSGLVEVQVYKVQWYWWWNVNKDELADFVSRNYNDPLRSFTLETDNKGLVRFDYNTPNKEWGTYLITVRDKAPNGHRTGVLCYFDIPGENGHSEPNGMDKAMQLNFKTDKEQYTPGEEIVVRFPSTEGSRAIVSVENGVTTLSTQEITCLDKETTIKLKATAEMQPNAYIHITLIQPHGITKNDLPIRLYGVVPLFVESPESHLIPVINAPQEIKPESEYRVSISEKSGREMAYTLAIVDEGLLDLTRFKTPDPWAAFNAREALGVRHWDIYNYVLGAYGGRIEQMFSIGGDDALNKGPKAIVNRFKPIVRVEGPFVLKKGETKQHRFTMDNYNGRVRIMAVAGNGSAYGSAQSDMLVRNPIMVLGTLPRVIGIGEEMYVPVTVFATQDNIGDVKISLTTSDNMQAQESQTIRLDKTGDKTIAFRVKVGDKTGVGRVKIVAEAAVGHSTYDVELEIRAIRNKQITVTPITLEAGKEWQEMIHVKGAAGTNKVVLEVGNVPPLNLSARLDYLTSYPHGCLEQTVSGAFPLLYIGEFTDQSESQKLADQRHVKEVIDRLKSYQMADGSFAYWPGQPASMNWASVYTGHFLFTAQSKGYLIPDAMKNNYLHQEATVARAWKVEAGSASSVTSAEMSTQAYRLYVLTLAQKAEIGAMNRLREESQLPLIGRWLLAAAYANIGKKEVATQLITATSNLTGALPQSTYDPTFGSEYRDQAIQLQTLCLLGQGNEAATLARNLSAALSSTQYMSTQTTAYALIALSQYLERYKTDGELLFTYTYGKVSEPIKTIKNIWAKELATGADQGALLKITNTSEAALFARVITTGEVEAGNETASANGIELNISYIDISGRPIDPANLVQGTNFSAIATVRNPSPIAVNNLVLSQIFPSGWEILNTRYLSSDSILNRPANLSYQDIRDDRVYSYIDLLPSGRQVVVKINLYAAYAGRYRLPAATCQAMYDELIRANTAGGEAIVKREE